MALAPGLALIPHPEGICVPHVQPGSCLSLCPCRFSRLLWGLLVSPHPSCLGVLTHSPSCGLGQGLPSLPWFHLGGPSTGFPTGPASLVVWTPISPHLAVSSKDGAGDPSPKLVLLAWPLGAVPHSHGPCPSPYQHRAVPCLAHRD